MNQMRIDPVSDDMKARADAGREATIALMRSKVAKALGEAPEATEQIAHSIADDTPSKHQLFMRDLANSGKSLAEIQTEWHRYYTLLPDKEKREVWDEFYNANHNVKYEDLLKKQSGSHPEEQKFQPAVTHQPNGTIVPSPTPAAVATAPKKPAKPKRIPKTKVGEQAQKLANAFSGNGTISAKQHLQSLMFGLGMGALVLGFILFGFFNEYFISPFIQPSRAVTDTPIIMTGKVEASAQPTIIVPKINVQVPVDFAVPSIDEATVQASLKGGVVHYPSTVKPGENGNGAYFGHSSQNILNSGKFKYAFIALRELTTGDLFYVTYEGKVFIYQVFAREVVPPTQVSVLGDTKGKQATAALITCDPPGISTNRLVVWGEQISPSIATNTAPQATPEESLSPAEITGKGPSAWSRFMNIIQFWKSPEEPVTSE